MWLTRKTKARSALQSFLLGNSLRPRLPCPTTAPGTAPEIHEGDLRSPRTHLCGNICADDTSNEKSKAVSLLSSSYCRYTSAAQVRQRCWGLFFSAMTTTFFSPEYSLQLNFLFSSEIFLTKSVLIYLGRKMLFYFLHSPHCCPFLPTPLLLQPSAPAHLLPCSA